MVFTVIAYLLLATLLVVGLCVLMVPVYLWLQYRDGLRLDEARRTGLLS